MLRTLRLWGTDIEDSDVLDLVGLLRRAGFDSTAAKLTEALTWGRSGVSLSPLDRECLFRVLADPPESLVQLRATLLMSIDDPPGTVLACVECECVTDTGPGWVAVIVDDPDGIDPAGIATYCPPCAARLLEYAPRAGVYT